MESIINAINGLVWSNALVFLCLAAGFFFTFKICGAQFTMVKEMYRLLFEKDSSTEGVSSFEAVSMAVAGRVGTGNIAGVATAIALGGPGSIFWLWVISLLGGASSYIESCLGQLYKEKVDGKYRGGPSYYFKKGLLGGKKWYGNLFAITTLIAMGMCIPGVQSNTIATSVHNAFGVSPVTTGIILTIALGLIIMGGVKRIGKVASIVVPFMAVAYILIAITILVLNYDQILPSFALIVKSAFNPMAGLGGIFGAALQWGIKRGIFSNEAGQGTGPASAAVAEVSHPAKQGLAQAFSIYIDSIFVCTATALMIIITGAYKVFGISGDVIYSGANSIDGMTKGTIGALNTATAIDDGLGHGAYIVAIAIIFFAFTTILAYFWNGDTALIYFTEGKSKTLDYGYKIIFLAFTFYGSINTGGLAWTIGDIGVGIMAWVNIIGILIMYKPAITCLRDYQKRLKEGRQNDWDFDPNEIGIEGDFEVWEKVRKDK